MAGSAPNRVNLDDADLLLTLNFAPTIGQVFTLIDNQDVNPIAGTFASVNGNVFGVNNTFTLDFNSVTYSFRLSYEGNGTEMFGGNNLILSVVPEPSSLVLLVSAMGLFALSRRRA